jgi:hypothetical protein
MKKDDITYAANEAFLLNTVKIVDDYLNTLQQLDGMRPGDKVELDYTTVLKIHARIRDIGEFLEQIPIEIRRKARQ